MSDTILDMPVQNGKDADEAMRLRGYVTVTSACKRVKRPWPTVYWWLQKGRVKSAKIGRRRYVNWKSMVKWMGPEAAKALRLDPDKP